MKKNWIMGAAAAIFLSSAAVLVILEKSDVRTKADTTIVKREARETKEQLKDKMLNSIDYFNRLSIRSKEYYANIPDTKYLLSASIDYSKNLLIENSKTVVGKNSPENNLDTSTYYDLTQSENIKTVNNLKKVYIEQPYYFSEKGKGEKISTASRTSGKEKDTTHILRSGNLPFGQIADVVFPQTIVMNYLENDSAWKIEGESTYLNRKVSSITGTFSDDSKKKLSASTFKLLVDEQTGCVLSFQGLDKSGKVTTEFKVTEFTVDTQTVAKQFVYSIPSDFKKVNPTELY